MKADIHPQYNIDAKFTCACGAVYHLGSTKKDVAIEICSNCHPFFTGQEKVLDVAGRVEKFKARATSKKNVSEAVAAEKKAKKASKATTEKTVKAKKTETVEATESNETTTDTSPADSAK